MSGKNILVVDDNKVNHRVAAAVLKKYGAKVECAESGKDAISLFKLSHKFDVCFMDFQMPEIDGTGSKMHRRPTDSIESRFLSGTCQSSP